ncbi:MAG: hypothetical protein IPK97_12290 [Ahniella sp.]|nr:hypothetical protein [Ahniella sp.]
MRTNSAPHAIRAVLMLSLFPVLLPPRPRQNPIKRRLSESLKGSLVKRSRQVVAR